MQSPLVSAWVRLFLAFLAAAVSAAPAVVCPSKLSAGQVHTCFVAGAASSQPSAVGLSNAWEVVVSGTPVASSPGLYSLALPSDLPAGAYTVQVNFTAREAPKTAAVEVVGESALLLLEADKALYKPGQTAQFRVLAVRPGDLKPLGQRQVEFAVQSPTGFKLLQVEKATDEFGVARFDFPIAAEPLMGPHLARATAIGASGNAAVHEVGFSVEEYVLPRFEVNISLEQEHVVAPSWQDSSTGTTTLRGQASATYTYGEGVAGKAQITVMTRSSGSFLRAPRVAAGMARPAVAVEGDVMDGPAHGGGSSGSEYLVLATQSNIDVSADAGASFSVEVPRNGLSANSDLLIEASIVDDATGERQNGTATLPVVYQGSELSVSLQISDGSEVFRPGLPTTVRIQLLNPSGGLPDDEIISSKGTFHLVVERNLVSWQADSPGPLRVAVAASDFTRGVAEVEIPNQPDSADCCDPLAAAGTYDEYMDEMGCCTQTVNMHVEADDNQWLSEPSGVPDARSYLCLSRAYSPTGHFLAVVPPGTSSDATVQSTLSFSEMEATGSFLAIQGGSVAAAGESTFAPESAMQAGGFWEARLPVALPPHLSGDVKLVVVARTRGGSAITGSASFSRAVSWPFSLSAVFSTQEVLPGADVSISLATGAPNAHVFVASLDRSAELLGPRAAIGESAMLAGLQRASTRPPSIDPRVWRECSLHQRDVSILAELDGEVALLSEESPRAAEPPDDADSPYGRPLPGNCPRPISTGCSGWGGGGMVADMAEMDGAVADGMAMDRAAPNAGGGASPAAAESSAAAESPAAGRSVAVRRFFPETWIWSDYAMTGGGGTTRRVPLVAPDTITTWSLEAFATTPDGVAAVRAEVPLRVFKPFFVEARLPYSALRGEELEVVLAVYNYKDGSASIEADLQVTLPTGLELVSGQLRQVVSVEEGSAARASIVVRPSALGAVLIRVQASASAGQLADALERSLLVRPEGFQVRETQNLVLELSRGGPAAAEAMRFDVPAEAVAGSTRGSVSVVGDLLGPTISGLESLLQIPTGCGEQNMIGLAPNVYVGKYLTSVGRLRPDLRDRIARNLLVGYGRELTYRHGDGSFSAFGESDEEGSTWLTAFVLKTFAEVHALGLITVDRSILESAASWLVAQQAGEGYFQSRGHVIHQEMMGGLGDASGASAESSLTSYVTAALAKARTEVPALDSAGLQSALQSAEAFLQAADSATRTYTRLLRTHALLSAGLLEASQATAEVLAMSELDATGTHRHWTGSLSAAQDVELTGYGVQVLTLAGSLAEAFQGSRWLLKRRSASGGFHSTQDTVVALSALAAYASSVSGSVDVTVSLAGAGGLAADVQVSSSNIDVLQTTALPDPSIAVNVSATGTGMVLVVGEVVYNLPAQPIDPCYELEVHWFESTPLSSIVRGCATPLPNCSSVQEGMWIMSVGLFTGYSASKQSLEARRLEGALKRYELGDTKVELYLEELNAERPTCVEFNATKDHDARRLQAATSEVFEYYSPERQGAASTAFALEQYVAPPGADVAPGPTASFAANGLGLQFHLVILLVLLLQVAAL